MTFKLHLRREFFQVYVLVVLNLIEHSFHGTNKIPRATVLPYHAQCRIQGVLNRPSGFPCGKGVINPVRQCFPAQQKLLTKRFTLCANAFFFFCGNTFWSAGSQFKLRSFFNLLWRGKGVTHFGNIRNDFAKFFL